MLRLDAVSLNLGGRQILDRLHQDVAEGTIHAILGPNASGKSSLAFALMGCCTYQAQGVPIVTVTDEFAKVTHEAAIGRLDDKQVQTLMARGLDETAAIDFIVRGMLR